MAVTLVGEIVNSADATTGFSAGNISGDDDFVEGTGALGVKASSTTTELYTTSLGATAPYDFSVGGGEEGYHMIIWFNTKTPINATSGLRMVMGNGTDRGNWYVVPNGFYKGGFITRVIDPTLDFDVIQAGTWTTTGNPAQLTNITEMGGGFTTITSIMGSFNNVQIDQFTIGLGLRIDAGTVGSPNTFETVRAADEDTAYYGWWGSTAGSIIAKGKLFVGPSTGTATSVFTDSAFSITWADERVNTDFYEINMRGANTDVNWELGSIRAANTAAARWGITVQSDTGSFDDINSVWSGSKAISLNANSTLTGTTIIDGQSMALNSGTLNGITLLTANTAENAAYITTDTLNSISNSVFDGTGAAGHAIEITSNGTYSFAGNQFIGYNAANNTSNSAILNSATGLVTINVSEGDTPSVRNINGSSTVINNTVIFRVTNVPEGAEVRLFRNSDQTELAGVERINIDTPSNGTVDADPDNAGRYRFNYSHQETSTPIYIVVLDFAYQHYYQNFTITNSQSEQSLLVSLIEDRQYFNPS